jgi:flagellar hook protein FlgE
MMRTSVSGMSVQADRLSTVADNIANVGTTGYKRTAVEFQTQVLDFNTSSYNSGGVSSVARTAVSQQGPLRGTTSGTDLAIDGDGFFVVQDEKGEFLLTRAGSFVPDDEGNLVNAAGFTLLGYDLVDLPTVPVANGFAGLVPVNVAQGMTSLKATPSSLGEFVPNLPVNSDIIAAGSLPSDNAVTSEAAGKTSLLLYDNLGNEVTIDLYFAKSADDTWEISIYSAADSTDGGFPYSSPALLTSTLDFDPSNGQLLDNTQAILDVPVPGLDSFTIDMTGISQLGSDYTYLSASVDGNPPTSVERFEVDTDGTVYGIYQNGYSEALYRIGMARVPSPDSLRPLSGNAYSATIESGDVLVGLPADLGFGSIVAGALEESNVDLASELTIMIESQRSYTANSKVFQTGSDLMDVLISLKR